MGAVFQTWLYDGDPLIGLDFSQIIENIRRCWADDPLIFQKMTEKWLLNNPHRVLAVMEPDPDFNEKKRLLTEKKWTRSRHLFVKKN